MGSQVNTSSQYRDKKKCIVLLMLRRLFASDSLFSYACSAYLTELFS